MSLETHLGTKRWPVGKQECNCECSQRGKTSALALGKFDIADQGKDSCPSFARASHWVADCSDRWGSCKCAAN